MAEQATEEVVLRRKSAMVLFSLEHEIGRVVGELAGSLDELDQSVVSSVAEREASKGRSGALESPQDLLALCYFDEVLVLLEKAAANTTIADAVGRLRELTRVLGLYEIRNACAHPLRKFAANYWYRTAAICSDPFVQRLGLSEVAEALAAAEAGAISDPPIEWIESIRWSVPNNLPSVFDHSSTGLIGRNLIARSLRDAIAAPRTGVVAVVARGGIGKTALVLDTLDQIAASPEASKWFDRIVFVSMKTEKLTASGRMGLEASRTVNELKAEIAEALEEQIGIHTGRSAEEVFDGFSSDRILVCLDNLETILRDEPGAFAVLNASFPDKWRVLITSRVTVDGAVTVRLGELPDKDAQVLALRYARASGFALPNRLASDVARLAGNNPLAVKLTVDLIAKGKDLSDSARWVESEVSQFSYDNLIEALSDNAVRALEAIFAMDLATRADIIAATCVDADAAAEALGELSRTSLVFIDREESVESYGINESVRDFLRVNPRNLKFRAQVQEQLAKRRAIRENNDAVQVSSGLHPASFDFISPGTEDQLAELAIAANRAARQKGQQRDSVPLLARFRTFESEFGDKELFWRAYGRVMLPYDIAAAEAMFEKGACLSDSSSEPQCKGLLAFVAFRQGEYSKSADLYRELLRDGWGDEEKAGQKLSKYVREGLAKALLYGGKFSDALEATEGWDTNEQMMAELAASRVGAFRQLEMPSNERTASLCSAFDVLDKAVATIGVTKSIWQQGLKVYRDAMYLAVSKEDPILVDRCAKSLASNIPALSNYLGKQDFQSLDIEDFLRVATAHSQNAVEEIRQLQKKFAWISKPSDKLLAGGGYVVAKVDRIPRPAATGFPKFLFAITSSGEEIFVGWNSLKSASWVEWTSIRVGTELIVKPHGERVGDKFPTSVETHIAA